MLSSPRLALDPEAMIKAAVVESDAGDATDLGDADFLDCLKAFCDSVREEARLPEAGIVGTEAYVVRLLTNRLRFHRDLREYPHIRDEQIAAPVVVLGLPRTGTTKLQRILSEDPGMQRLDMWRLLNPAPIGPPGTGEDPRIAVAREYDEAMQAFPGFLAAHPHAPMLPDEDIMLSELTFDAYIYPLRFRVPTFAKRLRSRPAQPSYAYLRKLLQYLQWQDGGGRGRPWVLKTPLHIGNLPALLQTFPGATVVHCHRDPRVAMPSLVRLIEEMRKMSTDAVDVAEVRDDCLAYWPDQIAQNLADRDRGYDTQVIDVMFEDIRDDVRSVIDAVYAKAGLTVSPEAAAKFAAWERDSPHEPGRHKYSLEHALLNDEIIEEHFGGYLARFFPDAEAHA
jgi:Sulfotransferase family